jgi:hypothetical protein
MADLADMAGWGLQAGVMFLSGPVADDGMDAGVARIGQDGDPHVRRTVEAGRPGNPVSGPAQRMGGEHGRQPLPFDDGRSGRGEPSTVKLSVAGSKTVPSA